MRCTLLAAALAACGSRPPAPPADDAPVAAAPPAGCLAIDDPQALPRRAWREHLDAEPALSRMRAIVALAPDLVEPPPDLVFLPDDCALAPLSVDLTDPARARGLLGRLVADLAPGVEAPAITGGRVVFRDGHAVEITAPRTGHDPGYDYCVPGVGGFRIFDDAVPSTDAAVALIRDITATRCGPG